MTVMIWIVSSFTKYTKPVRKSMECTQPYLFREPFPCFGKIADSLNRVHEFSQEILAQVWFFTFIIRLGFQKFRCGFCEELVVHDECCLCNEATNSSPGT